VLIFLFVLFIVGFLLFLLVLRKKNMHIWFVQYCLGKVTKKTNKNKTTHVMFCFVDHYEPQWKNPNDIEKERARVERWYCDYPSVAGKHYDSDGCHPKHSFFYPEEEYRKEHLDKVADLCARGFGEIEVHIHHDNDTSDNFRETLESFTELLHKEHGAFSRDPETNKLSYCFIHGNWALCNSRPDGRWCGVNDELLILKETGCYADMTYPSAPSDTQPPKINSIYYASDKPGQSRSHDTGVDVRVNGGTEGDLMIIQGPLGLNFQRRKKGIFPQIENSDVRGSMPPTNDRVDMWVNANIHVKDKPEWLFIKVHTHGTQEQDMDTLLGQPFDNMCSYLESKYNDGKDYKLHYVSAREMFNIIKAAEAGKEGNPNEFRDYILPKPNYKRSTNL
jgi:hypothetical protein